MNFLHVDHLARRQGKSTMNIAMTKFYLSQEKKVIFATANQSMTIIMLRGHFPKALFELVEDWGILIHERKT